MCKLCEKWMKIKHEIDSYMTFTLNIIKNRRIYGMFVSKSFPRHMCAEWNALFCSKVFPFFLFGYHNNLFPKCSCKSNTHSYFWSCYSLSTENLMLFAVEVVGNGMQFLIWNFFEQLVELFEEFRRILFYFQQKFKFFM